MRKNNMIIPKSISKKEQETLEKLLLTFQQVMHDNNLFIKDFKQILEITDAQLSGGKVVISSTAKPKQAHKWTLNVQQNLQELSIVTNEQPHDLVIHNCAEGKLQTISNLNHKDMLLYFTLFFPQGVKDKIRNIPLLTSKAIRLRRFFEHPNINQGSLF